jgi:outer membrane protein OmpA-like peptidoglycan-associated protein
LNRAYLLEAFGEHFYTDSFSGGHIRTPRKDISDWYTTVFGPRVVDHFINTLRGRIESEIYNQVIGLAGIAIDLVAPGVTAAVRLFISHEVGEKLDAAIAGIGGRAVMIEWFGLIVGGMVSGAIHDMEGDRGVIVNSQAHPAPWTAYGDGLLDDPRNATSKSEVIAGVAEAKADIDQAYLVGSGERIAKASVPIPAPSALPSTIYFGFDSSSLSASARTDMKGALAYMTYNPDAEVSLVGHTDPVGNTAYNLDLGSRRANAVASTLLGSGIDPKRVLADSAGETSLVTTKPAEYWRDRRVTLAWGWGPLVPGGVSRDVAYERSMAAIRSRIGPPYWAEKRFPEPVAGANPAVPEWHWGKLDPTFQGQIAAWVGGQVRPYVGGITSSPLLAPISVPVAKTTITVDPRPIVRGIIDDLLAHPIDFLNAGFGERAGP